MFSLPWILFHYVLDTCFMFSILPFLCISPYVLSTIVAGIHLFNVVSSNNLRCFLIGDICTLLDVRVRALCCELSGALGSALCSSSVSQVAVTRQSVNGEKLDTHLHSRWTATRGLCTFFCMKSIQSVCPSLVGIHSGVVMTPNLWTLAGEKTVCGDIQVISIRFAICFFYCLNPVWGKRLFYTCYLWDTWYRCLCAGCPAIDWHATQASHIVFYGMGKEDTSTLSRSSRKAWLVKAVGY